MDNNSSSQTSRELPLLTFNSLLNFLREEKKNIVLIKLPELFYEGLEDYLSNKLVEINKLKNDSSQKSKLEKEKYILKKSKEICLELINLRCVKISNIGIKNKLFGGGSMTEENIDEKEIDFMKKVQKSIFKIKNINY